MEVHAKIHNFLRFLRKKSEKVTGLQHQKICAPQTGLENNRITTKIVMVVV